CQLPQRLRLAIEQQTPLSHQALTLEQGETSSIS
ncbi:hypothetical protein G113_20612, partial [Aeromonas molluscorum 848]